MFDGSHEKTKLYFTIFYNGPAPSPPVPALQASPQGRSSIVELTFPGI